MADPTNSVATHIEEQDASIEQIEPDATALESETTAEEHPVAETETLVDYQLTRDRGRRLLGVLPGTFHS